MDNDPGLKSLSDDIDLRHYTSTPVQELYSVKEQVVGFKPKGFWVSVDGNGDGWKDWCEAEAWNMESFEMVYDVTLCPNANILLISNPLELDNFTEKFSKEQSQYIIGIDWAAVSELYQGVIIAPYIYSRRLERNSFWYYGWDCASGCIWDVDAIDRIKEINHE